MKRCLPKVLVVGINAWREDGTAHTLKNIFSCWDSAKLALVYTRADLPYTNVASRYFQISEIDVLESVFKPWLTVGREVDNKLIQKDIRIEEEHKRYAKAHTYHSDLLPLCREFVWLLGHWRSKRLKKFVSDFDPDILFIPIYPTVYMGWLQRLIIKWTAKPFVCYLADDNYSYESCKSLWAFVHRFWLRRNVKWLAEHCRQMFVIVDKEKEETDRLFGTNSVILTKSVDFSKRPYVNHSVNKPISFVYTGSLIIGRDKTLALIADAINEVNKKAGKILARLNIYSGDIPAFEVMNRLNKGAAKYNGFLQRSEIDRVQQEADVVVFAEALEGKDANIARLSFSTKITDYLANGKCVLAVGKDHIAPIDYFVKNDSAIVVTEADQIYAAIKNLCDNSSLIEVYSKKAYDCAVRNHEKAKVDKMFIENMCKVAVK